MRQISGDDFAPDSLFTKVENKKVKFMGFHLNGEAFQYHIDTYSCDAIIEAGAAAHKQSSESKKRFYYPRGYGYAVKRILYLEQEQAVWIKEVLGLRLKEF